MKQRIFALAAALVLLLSGCCCKCDTQVEQLQQRVADLENQLAAITVIEPASTEPAPTEPASTEPAPTEPASTEPAPTEPASTEPAPTEPAPTEPASTEPATDEFDYMSSFLHKLLDSNMYSDWMSVAECSNATLDNLLRCAEMCASIDNSGDWAYDIADQLVQHDNATSDVVEILCGSHYYRVLYRISYADCNDAHSLIAVAKECASIDNSEDWAYDIADQLVKHPKFTAQVAMELVNSCYPSVRNLAHEALDSLLNKN